MALVAAALIAAVLPTPRWTVERWYSAGVYPSLQSTLTPLSNRVPVAVLDIAAAAVVVMVIATIRRRCSGVSATRAALRLVSDAAGFASVAYLLFLALWGLNYRRVPLEEKLDYERSRVSVDQLRALGEEAVRRVNTLHPIAHGVVREEPSLDAAFVDAQRILSSRRSAATGVPKRSLLTLYFRWAAIDGMTDPYFLEIIVNPDVLPVERPFVVAHEWAHLAGYADEADANFVAWLTCVRGSPAAQYSGWLAMYEHLSGSLSQPGRRALAARLDPGPREDLTAIAARYARSAPVVRRAAREVYDSYLKANRVEEGIASYDAVVRLVLGTTFDDGWVPRLRAR